MFFIKQNQNQRASEEQGKEGDGKATEDQKKITMFKRLNKDMNELDIPENIEMTYCKDSKGKDDLQHFKLKMKASEDSLWYKGIYHFKVDVPDDFPISPPKVHCDTQIFHPNIDMDGNVCLNILRKDWTCVLSINHLIFGLETLFLNPNPMDPLNKGI